MEQVCFKFVQVIVSFLRNAIDSASEELWCKGKGSLFVSFLICFFLVSVLLLFLFYYFSSALVDPCFYLFGFLWVPFGFFSYFFRACCLPSTYITLNYTTPHHTIINLLVLLSAAISCAPKLCWTNNGAKCLFFTFLSLAISTGLSQPMPS